MDEMKGQKGQPTHVACRSSLLFVEGVDQTQFNILPRANPGRLTITYALGVGQFTRAKRIAKSGEFDRLWVVPHFPSGIVERAKRECAWKSPHARTARRGGETVRVWRWIWTGIVNWYGDPVSEKVVPVSWRTPLSLLTACSKRTTSKAMQYFWRQSSAEEAEISWRERLNHKERGKKRLLLVE